MLWSSLAFAIEVCLPIAIIILLGAFINRIGWINDEFANIGSRLVFNLTLPCLLFVNISQTSLTGDLPWYLIAYAAAATTLIFGLFHCLAYFIQPASVRGAFVQGACRGNMAIVGLAFCLNAFGDKVLPLVSMYLATIVIPYNIYSILTLYYHKDENPRWSVVGKSVLTNPLAIAICLALIVAYIKIPIPVLMLETGEYLARMTLPLALLCAGASIRWQEFRSSVWLYLAIAAKIAIIPAAVTIAAYNFGIRGDILGILYLMMAAPTAAAAYPMVRTIGGDYHLTSAIIAGSTVLSMLTTTVGLFILRYIHWI